MTISSSMNAGVAGLNVNASKLATIADNIANSKTYGYKRVDADFSAMTLPEQRGKYTAGGVRVSTYRQVTAQGALISTANATDIAVGGRGMLPVTSAAAIGAGPGPRCQRRAAQRKRAGASGLARRRRWQHPAAIARFCRRAGAGERGP